MSSLDDRRVALQGGGHRHLHLQHPPPPYTASYPLVRWHFSFIPLFSCPRSTKAARVLRSLVLGTRTVSKLPRKSSVKSIKPALQLDHVSIRTTFVLAACKLTYVSVSGSILSSRGSPRVTLKKGRKKKRNILSDVRRTIREIRSWFRPMPGIAKVVVVASTSEIKGSDGVEELIIEEK